MKNKYDILTEEQRRNIVNDVRFAVTRAGTELDFIYRLLKELDKFPDKAKLKNCLDIVRKKHERAEKLLIKLQLNGNARKEKDNAKR